MRFRNVAPWERFFRTYAKKIFLDIVVENAPIPWFGNEFATLARFRLRSRMVPKSCSMGAVFSHACKKIFVGIVVGNAPI